MLSGEAIVSSLYSTWPTIVLSASATQECRAWPPAQPVDQPGFVVAAESGGQQPGNGSFVARLLAAVRDSWFRRNLHRPIVVDRGKRPVPPGMRLAYTGVFAAV